jgi:hypothetical protein
MFFSLVQLMRRNPEKRLGGGERDAYDIKRQPFFRVSLLSFYHLFPYPTSVSSSSRGQTGRNWPRKKSLLRSDQFCVQD